MKKLFVLFLNLILVFSLVACSNNQREQNTEPSTSESESETASKSATLEEPATEAENTGGKTLVVYYSATGSTKNVAEVIADAANAELFELEPVETYSIDDLDWTNDDSRVTKEHENESERVVELVAATVDNWEDYDTIFIGYPIWWGIAAWPVNEFIDTNDFSDKTIIPFCTSASSGLGESGELLEEMAGTGNWQKGQRFCSGASEDDVRAWLEGLDL